MKKYSPFANQSGFTLLETMIAMAIMLISFASILMVQSSSINTSARAKQMNVVAMLAKSKMVETELDFEGKTFEEYKKEESGQFKDPFQDYSWKKEVKEIKFPQINLGSLGKTTDGKDSGDTSTQTSQETLAKLVSNYLSKAIREVTVTITWRQGSGTQSFQLSTYWVNLNHEFALSQ